MVVPSQFHLYHCTEIQVQFQRSCSTEAQEDKDPKIFLCIQVIIEPSTAILGTEVTLNFSVVDGSATGKLEAMCVTSSNLFLSMKACMSFAVTFLNLLAEDEDFRLIFQRLTLCQGTISNNVQSLVVDITDDFLVEGTESFVVSGDATAPASFVPGNDSATVTILDNDGECG